MLFRKGIYWNNTLSIINAYNSGWHRSWDYVQRLKFCQNIWWTQYEWDGSTAGQYDADIMSNLVLVGFRVVIINEIP